MMVEFNQGKIQQSMLVPSRVAFVYSITRIKGKTYFNKNRPLGNKFDIFLLSKQNEH